MVETAHLRGVEAKLARAREHLAEFRAETGTLLESYDGAITEEVRDGGAKHVYQLYGEPPIPGHWSALVGDILHNLRCALDHLAWQLVLACGGEPTKNTAFPILLQKPDYETPDIPPGITHGFRQRIDQVQPYSSGVPDLRILRHLNNVDKHRELLPVVTYVQTVSWSVPDHVEVNAVPNIIPSKAGGTVAVFNLDPPDVKRIDATFRFKVGLDPISLESLHRLDADANPGFLLAGDLPNWALGTMTHFVGQIIERFRDVEG